MGTPHVHFVYIKKDRLRHVENEFSADISSKLDGWRSSSGLLKIRSGAVNVTFFIYRRAHVMMSHGVADKNYLTRSDARGGLEINKYRTVCVPGDWLKRKLLSTPSVELGPDQIKVVGWPRLDKLLEAQAANEKLHQTATALRPSLIKVLWAPTHAGGAKRTNPVSSYPRFGEYEDRLASIFDFSASLHPSVRQGGRPTFQALLDADVVIADRGTMVYEAWALGKPVIFPTWLIGAGNLTHSLGSAENHIFREEIGYHAHSFDEMVDMIRHVKKPDGRTIKFLEDYLPQRTRGQSSELISFAVREVWESGDLRVKSKVPPVPVDAQTSSFESTASPEVGTLTNS